jgi:transcription elongation factor GreA
MSNKKTSHDELTEEDLALQGASTITDPKSTQSSSNDDNANNTNSNDDIITDDDSSEESVEQKTFVTREGLKKLKEELDYLENTKRKENAARLKEAISFGDLSENSEYEDAKNEQALTEGRIAELAAMVKTAKIITEKKSKSAVVKIGSTVKIQNLTDKDKPETFTIVGSTEADPSEAKISNESPIGMAILDCKSGEEVIVKAPAGELKYKILEIK